ncbi:Rne/Rng family ribonuclease [Candidatus Shikimatogenerans silvanidophilus]|uniref:Rne/Rng family ribonuclease n=1 Tax=Candidatus Shikimatogenerans silvanidophilus TaxID=2782547 RepID=UPI001BA710CD|nr:Rne/Rng family ribonuclease [Candidatus Shikimatogenerans silvanidophilus]
MNKKLIINVKKVEKKIEIAIIKNGKLSFFYKESINKKISVGDIYLGKVKKIFNSLNAAFININNYKDAFLHYKDLYIKNNKKNISDILTVGEKILVQIIKEPIYNKGPRLTTEITIPGRYIVLIPFSDKILISKKIKNKEEINRLLKIIYKIKPIGFGIIIRTLSKNKKIEFLKKDIDYLKEKWNNVIKKIYKNKITKILNEENKYLCILRDTYNKDFNVISCNDINLYKKIKLFIDKFIYKKNILKYYNGYISIFEKYGVEKQIQMLLSKKVPFGKGGYLIIEHTETLNVIDVNSGNKEYPSLEINLLASNEIVKQIILRDMSGIIIIDFIDLNKENDKKILYEHFKKKMKIDRTKHKILPPTKFGLVQITRKRFRNQIIKKFKFNYKDTNISPFSHIYYIESILDSIIIIQRKKKKNDKIYLHTHPFISAYLKKGIFSIQLKWFLKYKKWIKIISRDSFKYLEFSFFNEKNIIFNNK